MRKWLLLLLAMVCRSQSVCPPNQLEEARSLVMAKQYAAALGPLQQLTASSPHCDPDEYRMLALTLLNLAKKQQALDTTAHGLETFPDSPLLQQYFVSVVRFAAPKEQALDRLRWANQIAPASRSLSLALCRALLLENPESAEAGARLKVLIAADPADLESHCLHAEWLLTVNRGSEALAELAAAQSLPVHDPKLAVNRDLLEAAAQDQGGNRQNARSAFESAFEENKRLTKPAFQPAWSYVQFLLRNGDDEPANKVLTWLLLAFPDSSDARLAKARVLGNSGDYQSALGEAQQALAHAINLAEQQRAHVLLSRLYHLGGDDEQARLHAKWIEAN